MSLRVYAIVPARSRVRGAGMEGERLRVVREGVLAAVLGDAGRRSPATPASLAAYDDTMRRIADQAGAIVPARYATLVEDESELRFILRTRARSLLRTLRRLRNRTQMTVRLAIGSPGRGGIVDSVTGRRKAASGAAYLRERARHAAALEALPEIAFVRTAVHRWIRDERIERRGRLATLYHLVPRASGGAYRRALERVARQRAIPVTISGPWTPYAFAGSDGGWDE